MNFCYHSHRGLQECACRTDSKRKRNQNFFRQQNKKTVCFHVRRQHENRSSTFVSMMGFCCDMSQRANNDLECPALHSKNAVGNVARNAAVRKTYETESLEQKNV